MSKPQRWQVIVTRRPEKVLRKLPAALCKRVAAHLDVLSGNPRPQGCKKLVGYKNRHRLRVADWRIVYDIKDDVLIVLVITIAPRGGTYQDL